MYPDNYMNPMTNPNYGYNRMQQVQQMQRAINPQVPNMFGQVEQPQQMQSFISAVPVTCLEEAKAARIALDGSMSVFVNIQDGEIYTKQLSMNGLAELKTYKLVNPQENKIEYVTSNDFNGLNQRVQNIENFLNQLGGQQNESNANDASIQPTPAICPKLKTLLTQFVHSRSPHTLLAAPILPLMDSVATMAVAASN